MCKKQNKEIVIPQKEHLFLIEILFLQGRPDVCESGKANLWEDDKWWVETNCDKNTFVLLSKILCVSGMYMGELVRQVLVDLMKDDLIFVGADRSQTIVKDKAYKKNLFKWHGK